MSLQTEQTNHTRRAQRRCYCAISTTSVEPKFVRFPHKHRQRRGFMIHGASIGQKLCLCLYKQCPSRSHNLTTKSRLIMVLPCDSVISTPNRRITWRAMCPWFSAIRSYIIYAQSIVAFLRKPVWSLRRSINIIFVSQ